MEEAIDIIVKANADYGNAAQPRLQDKLVKLTIQHTFNPSVDAPIRPDGFIVPLWALAEHWEAATANNPALSYEPGAGHFSIYLKDEKTLKDFLDDVEQRGYRTAPRQIIEEAAQKLLANPSEVKTFAERARESLASRGGAGKA